MTSPNRVSSTPLIRVRVARFEDVPDILRLLERAIERGCRRHYTARERRGVYASYALRAFLDVVGPYDTFVVEGDGGVLTAFAQLDSSTGWLRALFVDDEAQGQGLGSALLAHVIARAASRGNRRLLGAMSLNAVPFYEHAGFRPCAGRDHLLAGGVRVAVTPMERVL
jgi:GNAT superfamily N-acetyltransferase